LGGLGKIGRKKMEKNEEKVRKMEKKCEILQKNAKK